MQVRGSPLVNLPSFGLKEFLLISGTLHTARCDWIQPASTNHPITGLPYFVMSYPATLMFNYPVVSSVTCPFLGRMMGCFAPYDMLECLIRIPTLSIPFALRNGSSWYRDLAFFIALLWCATVFSPLVCSQAFNFFILMI